MTETPKILLKVDHYAVDYDPPEYTFLGVLASVYMDINVILPPPPPHHPKNINQDVQTGICKVLHVSIAENIFQGCAGTDMSFVNMNISQDVQAGVQ